MLCRIYNCDQMLNMPISQLGGIVVHHGQVLIVDNRMGDELKKSFGSKLIHVGNIEKSQLASGSFELAHASKFAPSNTIAAEIEQKEDAELKAPNKDMAGKTKGKVRTK